ncbi:hypothetical protein [Arthrobacter tecti]
MVGCLDDDDDDDDDDDERRLALGSRYWRKRRFPTRLGQWPPAARSRRLPSRDGA